MSFKVTKTEPRGSAKAIKIASSVTTVDATGSVTYTDVSGTVSNVDLASTVSHVAIAAGVAYRLISPSAVTLGYYLLRHEDFDFATIADIVNVTYSKNLFDEVSVVGDKTIFYNMKAPTDVGVISTVLDLGLQKRLAVIYGQAQEQISYQVDFSRTFNEPVTVGQELSFDTTKLLEDQPIAIEEIAFGTTTTKSDTSDAIDDSSYEVGKYFANTFNSSDVIAVVPTKVISDTADTADTIQKFDTTKLLAELINATDDYMGESNVDDDQTMHFGKTVIDNGSVSELFSRSIAYKRSLYDLFSSQDTTALAYNKPAQDSASGGTLFYRQVSFHRNFYNTAVPSDDIALFTSRVLQDNGTAIENAVKSSGKVNNDSASFIDSGKLFWQSYVEDPTYFADDYVGNSQNF
jgi:hypothetical protein